MRPRDAWLGLLAFALWVLAMVALGSTCGCSAEPAPESGVIRYEDACCPVCGAPAIADAEDMVCNNSGCPARGWPHPVGDSAADVLRQLGCEFVEG